MIEELEEIIEKLDKIDLKSKMINHEDLYDFMERLEDEYPDLFLDASSDIEMDSDEFEAYLWHRYGTNRVQEITKKYIWNPIL